MAKKKNAPVGPEAPSRARLELRLDIDVYEKMKRLADKAEISVNQLVQALARWAANNGHVGEPFRDSNGILRTRPQAGCVWIGRAGFRLEDFRPDDIDYESIAEKYDGPVKGEVELFLDFTERRVIREDVE